jgi:hypothetical protein
MKQSAKSRREAQRVAEEKRQQQRRSLLLILLGGVIFLALAFYMNKPKPAQQVQLQQNAGVQQNPASQQNIVEPQQNNDLQSSGAPSLQVDQKVIDLGNVSLGKTVSASFVLTNVGDQPLQFTKAPYIELLAGC